MIHNEDEIYDKRLGYIIKRVDASFKLKMDRELQVLGLTTPQYAALSALELSLASSNAELARRCFVTPQTMHQISKGLLNRGLLEHRPDLQQGRVQPMVLSEEGKEVLQKAHQLICRLEEQMIADVSRADVDMLKDILQKLLQALEKSVEKL